MTRRVVLAFAAGLVAGATLLLAVLHFRDGLPVSSAWHPLIFQGKGLAYQIDALIGPDIALPDVGKLDGAAKFLPTQNRSTVQLGYRVVVPVAPLDVAQLPAKYRQHRKFPDGLEILPTDQVLYEVSLDLQLKDGDGFVLRQAKSPRHQVTSGKDNVLQSIVSEPFPASLARRVASIEAQLSVEKCVTCQPGE